MSSVFDAFFQYKIKIPNYSVLPNGIYPYDPSLPKGIYQVPHSHSDQTGIHVYFVSKIPKFFDLLEFSRQKSDCFYGLFVMQPHFIAFTVFITHWKLKVNLL
jgi:hypothetical protein